MKKIIRVDIFKGEGKPMNEYCVNDKCKNKYKCPIYHYVNEKVTNEFYLKKYSPKDCEYGGKNNERDK